MKLKAALWIGYLPDAFAERINTPCFKQIREAYNGEEESVLIGDVRLYFIPVHHPKSGRILTALGIAIAETTSKCIIGYDTKNFVAKFLKEYENILKAFRSIGIEAPENKLTVFVTPEFEVEDGNEPETRARWN